MNAVTKEFLEKTRELVDVLYDIRQEALDSLAMDGGPGSGPPLGNQNARKHFGSSEISQYTGHPKGAWKQPDLGKGSWEKVNNGKEMKLPKGTTKRFKPKGGSGKNSKYVTAKPKGGSGFAGPQVPGHMVTEEELERIRKGNWRFPDGTVVTVKPKTNGGSEKHR